MSTCGRLETTYSFPDIDKNLKEMEKQNNIPAKNTTKNGHKKILLFSFICPNLRDGLNLLTFISNDKLSVFNLYPLIFP